MTLDPLYSASGAPVATLDKTLSMARTVSYSTLTPAEAGGQLGGGGNLSESLPSCTPAFAGVRLGAG